MAIVIPILVVVFLIVGIGGYYYNNGGCGDDKNKNEEMIIDFESGNTRKATKSNVPSIPPKLKCRIIEAGDSKRNFRNPNKYDPSTFFHSVLAIRILFFFFLVQNDPVS